MDPPAFPGAPEAVMAPASSTDPKASSPNDASSMDPMASSTDPTALMNSGRSSQEDPRHQFLYLGQRRGAPGSSPLGPKRYRCRHCAWEEGISCTDSRLGRHLGSCKGYAAACKRQFQASASFTDPMASFMDPMTSVSVPAPGMDAVAPLTLEDPRELYLEYHKVISKRRFSDFMECLADMIIRLVNASPDYYPTLKTEFMRQAQDLENEANIEIEKFEEHRDPSRVALGGVAAEARHFRDVLSQLEGEEQLHRLGKEFIFTEMFWHTKIDVAFDNSTISSLQLGASRGAARFLCTDRREEKLLLETEFAWEGFKTTWEFKEDKVTGEWMPAKATYTAVEEIRGLGAAEAVGTAGGDVME